MRVQHVAGVILAAAFFELAFLACQAKSYSDYPTDGADSGDDGDDGNDGYDSGIVIYPLGDDSSGADDLFTPSDAFTSADATPPCTMPSGTYTETITWQPDGGEGDSGAACQSSTTSFSYPPPNNDGSVYGCVYTVEGNLPICSIAFSCLKDDGTYTTRTTGHIDVFNGSYGGDENEEVLADDGGEGLFTCEFQLDFTPVQ
jgi:hypothetical protein